MDTEVFQGVHEEQKAAEGEATGTGAVCFRVAFHTLGCKVNFFDTGAMTALVAGRYRVVEGFDADALVLNTCAVTQAAWVDARKILRRFRRHNLQGKVVLTGCYAQIAPQEAAALKGVDWVLGTRDRNRLGEVLDTLLAGPPQQSWPTVTVSDVFAVREMEPLFLPRSPGRTRGFLRVQTGCNYRCTFCVIPMARGNSVSVDFEGALAQAARLIEAGHGEICPTGIHVADYGKDLRPRRSFTELLHALLELPGLRRLRLSSLDPHEVNDELLELVCQHPLMARHLHVAVQSADEDVLKAMKRRHSAADFEKLVLAVQRLNPQVAVGTDLITGFPTETEEQHRRTVDCLSRLPLAYFHVFPYSTRPGTAAAALEALGPGVVQARAAELRRLGEKKREGFAQALLGQRVQVLAEKPDEATGNSRGWTSQYVRAVFAPGVRPRPGDMVSALVTAAQAGQVHVVPAG